MKIHRIDETAFVPRPLEEVWDFFSDPRNLPRITPPALGFEFAGEPPPRVYPGLFLTYRVRPVGNVPLTWVTEITQVSPGAYFVDDQRSGPYAVWHHEHDFRAAAGGTELRDVIHYALPLDPLSRPAHGLLVAPRLREMMAFRAASLAELFPAAAGVRT